MKILKKCPTCHKTAQVRSETKIGTLRIATYECGHVVTDKGVSKVQDDTLDIVSLDGKHLFPFQLQGAQFAEAANFRCLIADEMGLGKTVQAVACMVAHKLKTVIVCKAGLMEQWRRECLRWGDLLAYEITGGKHAHIPRGADCYILSYDSAWRVPNLVERLQKIGVDTVVMDECQQIKNVESKRTKAVQDVCRVMNHVIALSGTPILNNAAEYFPVLNMLRPDKFSNKNQFVYGWCDSYFNGFATKTGGIKNPSKFMDYTKDFIIRRKRADVLPDLPATFRQYSFHELGDEVSEAYQSLVRNFQDEYERTGGSFDPRQQEEGGESLLGMMAKMRHLTGTSKIQPVCDFVEEFIASTDRKLAIFCHHIDVARTLQVKLTNMAKEWSAEWGPRVINTVGINAEDRQALIDDWRDNCRVAIFSTLASGEGLNLQFCSDCVIMEREWNPGKEEQAEARFPRPGQTADKINAHYPTAVGTIDEFMTELVEQKREVCGKTLDGKAVQWGETSLIKELADIIAQKGGKRWGW